MTKHNIYSVFIIGLSLMLSACDNQGKIKDLSAYIEKIKHTAQPISPTKDITAVPKPKTIVYQANNRRDPFEDTAVAFTQKASANPINAFPVTMLRFSGVMLLNNKRYALIIVPDGKVYQLTTGDTVGDRYGKISRIEADHLDVTEQTLDGNNRTIQQRIVTMPLKDGP